MLRGPSGQPSPQRPLLLGRKPTRTKQAGGANLGLRGLGSSVRPQPSVRGSQFPKPFRERGCGVCAGGRQGGQRGLPGPGVKLGQLKETRPGRCEEASLGPHFSTSQRPSGRAPKETPATEPHPLPRGPAPGREVPPRAGPPPRAHPSPRPGSRRPAGQSWAAQVEFWAVHGQQTPNRVFRETFER